MTKAEYDVLYELLVRYLTDPRSAAADDHLAMFMEVSLDLGGAEDAAGRLRNMRRRVWATPAFLSGLLPALLISLGLRKHGYVCGAHVGWPTHYGEPRSLIDTKLIWTGLDVDRDSIVSPWACLLDSHEGTGAFWEREHRTPSSGAQGDLSFMWNTMSAGRIYLGVPIEDAAGPSPALWRTRWNPLAKQTWFEQEFRPGERVARP